MALDISTYTRAELEKLKLRVDKALAKLAEKDKKAALAAAIKAAAAHGFSLAEITGVADDSATAKTTKAKTGPKSGLKKPSVAKYRNPADQTQTWTGKGRQPEWFKSALASGTTPDMMAI
jgi:DNA-binding protein H-NS